MTAFRVCTSNVTYTNNDPAQIANVIDDFEARMKRAQEILDAEDAAVEQTHAEGASATVPEQQAEMS